MIIRVYGKTLVLWPTTRDARAGSQSTIHPKLTGRRWARATIALMALAGWILTWSHAVELGARGVVRDFAFVVLTCIPGLREPSLLSLPAEVVTQDEHKVTAQLEVVKGKVLRYAIPKSYQRCATDLPSQIDLVARWGGVRTAHPLFFGMSGERWSGAAVAYAPPCDVAKLQHRCLPLQAARGLHTPCVLGFIPSAR
jgi:hypothetical protein